MSTPETLEVPVWVKRGHMLLRRDALDGDDPDHTYHYIRKTYGVDPEDYGIAKPPQRTTASCPCCGFRS